MSTNQGELKSTKKSFKERRTKGAVKKQGSSDKTKHGRTEMVKLGKNGRTGKAEWLQIQTIQKQTKKRGPEG